MKRLFAALAIVLLMCSAAGATPVNLSTFAPPSNPQCTLWGQDPTFNNGSAVTGTPLLAAVGDTITISLVVTNGTFTGPNILVVNGTSFNYSVTLPLQVTSTAPGTWSVVFATPGCSGSTLTIISH
jgi:hypothetical protein